MDSPSIYVIISLLKFNLIEWMVNYLFLLEQVKYKDILDINNLIIPKLTTSFIIGGSGSGKSTILKLLNKLISPDSGHIYYNDRPIKDIDSVHLRREIVMLSQSSIIFPGTIRDNLLIGLKFSEKNLVDDEDLKVMIKLVSLDKGLNEDPKTLSGGEKQRLSLARVLLMKPKILLLDEPSSALDEDTEVSVIATALDYAKDKGITPIVVSHSTLLKSTFSENTIEIKDGKIVSKKED